MTRCEWCMDEIENGITCSDSHRAKRYRFLRGMKRADGSREEPHPDSPLWASQQRLHAKPSGLQVSFGKALKAAEDLARRLGANEEMAATWAYAFMAGALPRKQLDRLEARK